MIFFPSYMAGTVNASYVQMVRCPDPHIIQGPYSFKEQETSLEAYLKYISLEGRVCLLVFLECPSLFRQA